MRFPAGVRAVQESYENRAFSAQLLKDSLKQREIPVLGLMRFTCFHGSQSLGNRSAAARPRPFSTLPYGQSKEMVEFRNDLAVLNPRGDPAPPPTKG